MDKFCLYQFGPVLIVILNYMQDIASLLETYKV